MSAPKLTLAICLLLLTVAALPQGAEAHPPTSVTAEYEDGTLNVAIQHLVTNTENHYIESVVVTDTPGAGQAAGDMIVFSYEERIVVAYKIEIDKLPVNAEGNEDDGQGGQRRRG